MTINMEKPYVVGMDIGGTNTVFGVVDSRGNVLASDSVKTQQYENIDDYVDAVCKKLLPLLSQFGGAEKIKMPKSVKKIEKDAFKGCKKLTLYVKKGSYAHKYAKKYHVKYKYWK